jgi:TolA-binding protein
MLGNEVEEMKKELELLQKKHEKQVRLDEDTVQRLRDEVKSLNEKLLHSSAMVMAQAAEHVKERRRFDEELALARGAAQTRKVQASPAPFPSDGNPAHRDPSVGNDTSFHRAGTDIGDDKSAASSATASTAVSGFRQFLHRNVSQDVADLLQRSKSFQSG